jgi:tetratricopeptide (TPR) repeat protein
LIGIFAVRYYRARLSFVILPFRPHVVTVVMIFIGAEVVQGIIGLITGSGGNGVANWAHVGGFVFGLAGAEFSGLDEEGRRAYLSQDAVTALAKNMPGAAIRRWEILLAREPNNATARSEMARAWLALGDMEQAGFHYARAIEAHMEANNRSEAALLYAEMREHDLRLPGATTGQLFLLGGALEEMEQFALAADTLRAATVRAPDAPETETALLKVISLYVNRLHRQEEAKILLRLFMERFPRSQFRSMAEDLMRAASAE